ncbi:MAG: AAA family ATPase [Candidatus Aminicenantes bacterium]|nr:AAA family ATPase [Candidatus Aminicenantes bacterium]
MSTHRKNLSQPVSIIPRENLSSDQLKIVEMPADENLFFTGPAGSGKTQMLIHRALHLAKMYQLSSNSYFLFVLTDIAKNYIRSGSELYGLPQESVTTFDLWCKRFYESHISKDLPRTYINLKLDHHEIRSKVLKELQRRKKPMPKLEFVLVDDGQDLAPESYEIFLRAAPHLTVFADFQQKITENTTSEFLISEKLGVKNATRISWKFHRNEPHILRLASHFLNNTQTKHDYLDQIKGAHTKSEQPQCYIAPSFDQEMDHMAETLKVRLNKGEKVAIVLPDPQSVHTLAKELTKRNVITEKILEPEAQNLLHDSYDFSNGIPKMATYLTVKGLTFDSVFLPQLTQQNYRGMDNDIRSRMLFLGVSRARHWVYFSTVKGVESGVFNALIKAQSEGLLLIY